MTINKIIMKRIVKLFTASVILIAILAAIAVARTLGRTEIRIDIHQNRELIHLSTFAEPPQFAIWLENPVSRDLKTVFVTHRVAAGDWEGKANVPNALPYWSELFRKNGKTPGQSGNMGASDLVISGATPKADFFTIRVEVPPESKWICWIEMNLAGDFNDAYPEIDSRSYQEDEFKDGQPALLYRADIVSVEGSEYNPGLYAQSVWSSDTVFIEPVGDGITTAKNVFDTIRISVNRPKPRLINKYRIKEI